MEVSTLKTHTDAHPVTKPSRTRVDKINAELVTLTYGTVVAQLCRDFDNDYVEVNKQLDKMGYNIGLRLIEDFLARSNMGRCNNFRETADAIAKVCRILNEVFAIFKSVNTTQVGFKAFLNVSPTITNWSPDGREFSLILDENPLTDFVELPYDGKAQSQLWYSNILCGALRGALEMVS